MSPADQGGRHLIRCLRAIRARWKIVLLTVLLAVIAAAVITYFMPKKFRASAALELRLSRIDYQFPDESMVAFVQTQLQNVRKKEMLSEIVSRLKLDEKWGTNGEKLPLEIACSKLKRMLDVQRLRNTEMIVIIAESIDRREAADIANAAAKAFTIWYNEQYREPSGAGLAKLKAEVKMWEEQVKSAQQEVNHLRAKLFEWGIEDTSGETEAVLPSLSSEQRAVFLELTAARKKLLEARTKLETSEYNYMRQGAQTQTVDVLPSKIWEYAEVAEHPSSPNWLLNLSIGGIIGLVIGVGSAVFCEYRDDTGRKP